MYSFIQTITVNSATVNSATVNSATVNSATKTSKTVDGLCESPFSAYNGGTFSLYLETVLDPYEKQYKKIITLDVIPSGGPLVPLVKRTQFPRLSIFTSDYDKSCVNVLYRYPCGTSAKKSDSYMYKSDIPSVIGYLRGNGYDILQMNTHIMYNHHYTNNQKEFICSVQWT